MKVCIEKIDQTRPEQVIIQCYRVTGTVASIFNYVKSTDITLAGYSDDRVTQLFLQDIFYVEAVDNRVFAYTQKETFELKCKLYEFEEAYGGQRFFRCSKSMVVNLMKIDSVYPILNGRFAARLFNGEEVIISRQYVSALKSFLTGGSL
ncbi:MAG TPA: LytTR family DNA-binding domain-containing protein [Feifaniaceae bacterium]|nr:LytTR family DNA-binding domain-containing protein [Feifaniaceae bacterium]